MTHRARRARGTMLVELLAGLTLGALVLAVAMTATASGVRLLSRLSLHAEVDDTAQLAVEAFLFDVRRAGDDPRAAGVAPLAEALADRLTLHADLDGDGIVDDASEEVTAYACNLAARGLSRIIGNQSLPLANDVVGCGFAYADETGAALVVPPAGLDAAARARVRLVTLDLALQPAGSSTPAMRRFATAVRVVP
ncbi:MAG TPA: hypothetical protein VMS22_22005 [Candidatus Eisenbacteria bacterium]|nr:hypothetical protein [Candidatus Eisenbacteria bacterium]